MLRSISVANNIRKSLIGCERYYNKNVAGIRVDMMTFLFGYNSCKLTTPSIDIDPAAHADRTRYPGLFQ